MDVQDLSRFPFFTGKMLKAFYGDHHSAMTLMRWVKKNKIYRIEKGKYTLHDDPRVYATTILVPSYCSFRSALYYYQLTNQMPLKLEVVVKKRKNSIAAVEFVSSKHVFGYVKEQVAGFDFFIADKEKLLLDCLDKPRLGVGIDELELLLKDFLDKAKIVDYLKRFNNVALIKRAGYLLEKNGIDIYDSFVEELSSDTNYPLLCLLLPKSTIINTKWHLNVNDG